MARRSEDYMAARRAEILDAVERCCLTKGWVRLTIDDVAKAAGLSKGGVYVHFASKLDLLQGLLERNMAEIEFLGRAASPEEFVEAIVTAMSGLDAPSMRAMAIAQSEIQLEGVRDPRLRVLIEDGMRRMTEVMEGLSRRFRPELSQEDVHNNALSIMFLLEGMRSYCALSASLPNGALQRFVARELSALLSPAAS